MWYVTMTDKFMSGWGRAEGKICKYVYSCDTLAEARIVVDNAENRSDQKHINIRTTKPYYNTSRYVTMEKDKNDCPCWYERNYFRNMRG
jgi:hypothetical protein